jgi:hypothetical protein
MPPTVIVTSALPCFAANAGVSKDKSPGANKARREVAVFSFESMDFNGPG